MDWKPTRDGVLQNLIAEAIIYVFKQVWPFVIPIAFTTFAFFAALPAEVWLLTGLWLIPLGGIVARVRDSRNKADAKGSLISATVTLGSLLRQADPVQAEVNQAPSNLNKDSLHFEDSLRVAMATSPPDFTLRADARAEGIVVFASQIFDADSGHKGMAVLVGLRKFTDGVAHTIPEFYKEGKFIGPLNLQPATDGVELHYGRDCGWWLIVGPSDKPRVEYWWGNNERGSRDHPAAGELIATIEIRAGGKTTERTVRYRLGGSKPEVVSVGP